LALGCVVAALWVSLTLAGLFALAANGDYPPGVAQDYGPGNQLACLLSLLILAPPVAAFIALASKWQVRAITVLALMCIGYVAALALIVQMLALHVP
jgi:hypothetical protein